MKRQRKPEPLPVPLEKTEAGLRTNRERLQYLAEYVEGVGAVEISRISSALTDTKRDWWLIRPADNGAQPQWYLGEGETLDSALETFCNYMDRERPLVVAPPGGWPLMPTKRPPLPTGDRQITLTLSEPPSANRWWRNVNGRMVTSKAVREYKLAVASRCLMQGVKPIPAPTAVAVVIEWHRSRKSGDLDKRLGVLLDALQGNCYDNDAQIVRIVAERRDGGSGTVFVNVLATGIAND